MRSESSVHARKGVCGANGRALVLRRSASSDELGLRLPLPIDETHRRVIYGIGVGKCLRYLGFQDNHIRGRFERAGYSRRTVEPKSSCSGCNSSAAADFTSS
jgi:hypothetical protein